MKKNCFFSLFCLILMLLAGGSSWSSEEDIPFANYYVRVKEKNINVRARPSTSSEVMYQLDKGQDVLVIGQTDEWVKIRPKEGATAWVHKDMVENGIISKSNVNIRVGPSLGHSILGRMTESDPVMVLSNQQGGEWLQIEMPRNFGFWVAKNLVFFLSTENEYQDYLIREKEAKKAFIQAEMIRKEELVKRYMDVDHERVIEAYQKIIDDFPGTPEAVKSMERLIDIKEKQAIAHQKKLTLKEKRRLVLLFDEAELMKKKIMEPDGFSPTRYEELMLRYRKISSLYPNTPEAKQSLQSMEELEKYREEKIGDWKNTHIFEQEGKLKAVKNSVYAEGTHELIRGHTFNRKTVCIVFCKKVDLRAFENKRVKVKGNISLQFPEKDIPPLVEVTEISLS
ncbi:MAG: SH3 domain-containing protein [Candidatus Aureabacteria bacterium]|nr:SH3 domain-containing protein [Candidatus Auribacterota bacterium]